jgi:hypothetical protein
VRSLSGHCLRLAAWFALLFSVPAPAALANMANPISAGSMLGDPSGALRSVEIVHEDLLIDLRPLRTADSALVEASYRIRNTGPAERVELLFVAVAMQAGSDAVWLDGRPAPATSGAPVPVAWRPPATTPPLVSGHGLAYGTRDNDGILFTLDLAPGEHVIRVRYRAVATRQSVSEDPLVYWQLAYVLSPARNWKSFGGLRATVLVPPAWSVSSDPPLDRHGDSLVGSWSSLPADALALTLQAPHPNRLMARLNDLAIDLLLAIGGVYVCIRLGRRLGAWMARRRWPAIAALPAGIAFGLVWGAAVLLGWSLQSDQRIDQAQRAWTYGYLSWLGWAFFALLAVVVAGFIMQITASRSMRRARAAAGRVVEGNDDLPVSR